MDQSLEKVQKELEQIKDQQNHQKQLADSAIRQRDMYRILLQTAGVELPPQGENFPFTPKGLSFVLVFDEMLNEVLCLCSGSEAGSQSTTPSRPGPMSTRSTPLRSAASESAQATQAKAALKQVRQIDSPWFSTLKREFFQTCMLLLNGKEQHTHFARHKIE